MNGNGSCFDEISLKENYGVLFSIFCPGLSHLSVHCGATGNVENPSPVKPQISASRSESPHATCIIYSVAYTSVSPDS